MSTRKAYILFLGLGFGLILLYFNSTLLLGFNSQQPMSASDDNSISHRFKQGSNTANLYTQKMESKKIQDSKTNEPIDDPLKNDSSPKKKKTTKKAFNSKTEIKFKVIEGYAVAAEDILLGQPIEKNTTTGQTFYNEEVKLWPNAEIPFAFDSKLSEALRTRVLQALDIFSKKTSVQFFEYNGVQKDFVVFSPSETLCASYVGKVGGAQPIFLNPNCQLSEIQHEIMHVLGFIHEHQREIRDQHLNILEENIIAEKLVNFEVLPNPFQEVYKNISRSIDTESLMIYPSKAFVKKPDLYSIKNRDRDLDIPTNQQLSPRDIDNINDLYFRKF